VGVVDEVVDRVKVVVPRVQDYLLVVVKPLEVYNPDVLWLLADSHLAGCAVNYSRDLVCHQEVQLIWGLPVADEQPVFDLEREVWDYWAVASHHYSTLHNAIL
jgi:hypothetical protein